MTTDSKIRESVPADTVLSYADRVKVKELSFHHSLSAKLLLAFFFLIAAASLFILGEFLLTKPQPPPALYSDPGALDTYLMYFEGLRDGTILLYDAIVVKGLVPIFLTLLGYTLGRRSR